VFAEPVTYTYEGMVYDVSIVVNVTLFYEINLYFLSFGSLMRSTKNGVIFNDEMDDFSYPTRNDSDSYKQTIVNYIEPGKRPLSSTAPTIITDNEGRVKMVVGASGGFKITTAVAQVGRYAGNL